MALLLFCLIVACALPLQSLAQANLPAIAKSNADFSDAFFHAVARGGQNLISSPLSAQLVLGMVQLGASGETLKEMTKALHLPENMHVTYNGFHELIQTLMKDSGPNYDLNIANRIFVKNEPQQNLNSQFLRNAAIVFGSDAQKVDFSAASTSNEINQWVASKTQGKIRDIIQPGAFDRSTQMVLVNAVYFKGRWASPFFKDDTSTRDFFSDADTKTPMQFMYQENYFKYAFLQGINAEVLVLPYKGDKLSLIIVLPKIGMPLSDLEGLMVSEGIGIQYLAARVRETEVEVVLPKFKLEVALDLEQPLKELGLNRMFSNSAEFSNLADQPLKISSVKQKAFIEISEEGTEAAVSSFAQVVELSLKSTPRFVANRPFLFYLVHQTTPDVNTVIFSGRFVKPQ